MVRFRQLKHFGKSYRNIVIFNLLYRNVILKGKGDCSDQLQQIHQCHWLFEYTKHSIKNEVKLKGNLL